MKTFREYHEVKIKSEDPELRKIKDNNLKELKDLKKSIESKGGILDQFHEAIWKLEAASKKQEDFMKMNNILNAFSKKHLKDV